MSGEKVVAWRLPRPIAKVCSQCKQTSRPDLRVTCLGPSHHPPIMEELLRASMPPDEGLADLIEWPFLDGQIDGETQALAFAWLERNHERHH